MICKPKECVNVDEYLRMHIDNYAETKRWQHCMKSVRIRSKSTDIYEVNPRIQSGYRKIRTRNNSVFGHFSRNGIPQYLKPFISKRKLAKSHPTTIDNSINIEGEEEFCGWRLPSYMFNFLHIDCRFKEIWKIYELPRYGIFL